MKKSHIIIGILAVGAIGVYASGILTPRTAEAQYRHTLMETVAKTAGSVSGILKGDLPKLDGHLAQQSKILAGLASISKDAFKEDTRAQGGRTDSKDAVWENWSDFSAKMDKFAETSQALAAAAELGNDEQIMSAATEVFKTCGGCHKDYRK